MTKQKDYHTRPMFKDTKIGTLEVHEIEQIIFDELIVVKAYIYRHFKTLDFSIDTLCKLHELLCGGLFEQAGSYRKHNVQVGVREAIDFFQVPIELKKLDEDIKYRLPLLKTLDEKREFLAFVMWRILWIHPFFDYNGRVTRLFGELFLLQQEMPLSHFRGETRACFAEAMKTATFEHKFEKILELI